MTEIWVLLVTENPAQNRDVVIEELTKFLEKKYYVKVVVKATVPVFKSEV